MTEALMNERQRLINLGYRLLGSLAEAEDVVQETYARWYALSPARRDEIEVPAAWLTRVAGRICLDLLGSARARRESYVGEWIPEPVPAGGDPADRVTLDESVSMAFLVMLESMTPAERVSFILHDVFRYPFAEVAEIVGRTPAACRQLASSARRRVRESHTPATTAARQAEIVREFGRAWAAKDIEALVSLLDPGVTAIGDGGGLVTATVEPVVGASPVAARFVGLAELATALTVQERVVNGEPGLVARDHDELTVLAFEITGEKITHIWAVRNPEKLRPWS
ncbi:RNA polymerase sigma factor SigJ [Amycolatopsis acidicola]|uniref:RNA polymerase sigma factor SigJ n=1 Tax=Amycolatopsis acidicola TaxID=2596893 RepID=A0A5N0USR4_9PSEU|nr:RNA polymerase sigma factor SigJ [Amycolatopsis acidicola]KAA9154671.1 RNA polymerase sigma factor SigJ [Amycolatopsis acidicola]